MNLKLRWNLHGHPAHPPWLRQAWDLYLNISKIYALTFVTSLLMSDVEIGLKWHF